MGPGNRLLIVSAPHDDHGPPVAWALRKAGVDPIVWDWSRYPAEQECSTYLNRTDEKDDWNRIGSVIFSEIDTVWYRRISKVTPHPETHEADLVFAADQATGHMTAMLHAIRTERWVNHPMAARFVESRLPQLQAARRVGLAVPPTLVSNSPADIANFRQRHSGDVIIKPFRSFQWKTEAGAGFYVETARIEKDCELSDLEVALCPNIYQHEIKKTYELRLAVFGEHAVALRIDSQHIGDSVDWRLDQSMLRIPVYAVEPPTALVQKCRAVLADLGLAFGAFDFIVDLNEDVYFVEVNQAGQFLFADDHPSKLPDGAAARTLERFCSFLTRDRVPPDAFPSMAEYKKTDEYAARLAAPPKLDHHPTAQRLQAVE
jgi:glutathione synthase/RimK-type ligase-like ATP-grasp enzyme